MARKKLEKARDEAHERKHEELEVRLRNPRVKPALEQIVAKAREFQRQWYASRVFTTDARGQTENASGPPSDANPMAALGFSTAGWLGCPTGIVPARQTPGMNSCSSLQQAGTRK